jgi:hypothetical protein
MTYFSEILILILVVIMWVLSGIDKRLRDILNVLNQQLDIQQNLPEQHMGMCRYSSRETEDFLNEIRTRHRDASP